MLADHAYRDTPALAAIQTHLEKKHQVLIVDIHLFSQVAELFQPHLVVINHLHDKARNRIVDSIRRRGGLCAVLPTEGRPNTIGQLEWTGKAFPAELCDLYLAWTEAAAAYLTPSVPRVIVGCPRFDFYGAYQKPEVIASFYGLDPSRKIVTVASSFPQAKFAGFATDFLKSDWDNLGVSKIPGREDPEKVAQADAEALARFMSWIAACIHEHPECQFVIKPHPAEYTLPWQEFCAKHNATLMLTDYAWNLLAMSDLHLARVGCLTAAEAWLIGKPSIQLMCGGDFIDGPTEEGLVGKTAADLRELLEAFVWHDTVLSPLQVTYAEKWLGSIGNSAQLAAEALGKLLEEKQPKTAFEFTFEKRVELNRLLAEHSKQYAVPAPDHLGQYAKVVTRTSVRDWLNKLRA